MKGEEFHWKLLYVTKLTLSYSLSSDYVEATSLLLPHCLRIFLNIRSVNLLCLKCSTDEISTPHASTVRLGRQQDTYITEADISFNDYVSHDFHQVIFSGFLNSKLQQWSNAV
jgi:hypothetical protein